MNGFGGLAGSYTLHPGQVPGISGHRPVLGQGLLSRLLRDQAGEQVERTLVALFTLCAHAHRRAARLALNAARLPGPAALPEPSAWSLTLETARDHLRSMALDWPRQRAQFDLSSPESQVSNQPLAQHGIALPAIDSESLHWLKACPLPLAQLALALTEAQTQEALVALRTWLQERVLLQPLDDWLAQHRTAEALARWCHRRLADLPPARYLASCHARASVLMPQGPALEVLDLNTAKQAAQLTDLAAHIATQTGFAQYPIWRGHCQETGTWTRLRHPPLTSTPLRQAPGPAWPRAGWS